MSSMVTKRWWMTGLVVGVVALATVGTGVVTASVALLGAPPKGATIAVVDLEKLINALDEKSAKGEEFKKAYDAKNKELDALNQQIKEKETALKAMPAASPQRSKAGEDLREMVFRAEVEAQLSNRKLDGQQAELFRDLYLKVNSAIEQLAQQNGYHMVLVSDETVAVPKGNSETVLRAITMKRMLFIAKDLDITEEVVKYMNNTFAAAGGKPAPVAAAGGQ